MKEFILVDTRKQAKTLQTAVDKLYDNIEVVRDESDIPKNAIRYLLDGGWAYYYVPEKYSIKEQLELIRSQKAFLRKEIHRIRDIIENKEEVKRLNKVNILELLAKEQQLRIKHFELIRHATNLGG